MPQDFGNSYFLERDGKWANDSLRLDRNSILRPTPRVTSRINDDPCITPFP